jgi:lipocalin/uncharacterized protein YbjT (DUF2867 family)
MAGTILLTGPTGYIGSRLLRVLEEGGVSVRCLARQPERVWPRRAATSVVSGDCLDEASLLAAMHGVDQAYYLVHSMASGGGFAALDHRAAANFGRAAARAGVRRIIYLGGLGDDHQPLSTHLKSRVETGQALRDSGVPTIEFRASIVIGAGSLSFEMIRALVERLPAMICPRWVDTRTQPIAIDDVLAYLRSALDLPPGHEGVFEIGGPDMVSYGDMMREYARIRGLRRLLIPVPLLTPRLSGLWLGLVTPAQARVGRALVEGLRNPTVMRSASAYETFAISPLPLREAFARAINEPVSTHHKSDTRLVVVKASAADAFAPIRRIGGANGWYFADPLWRLRGWLDRACGGIGMPRLRRDPDTCVVGDVIDGWRVEAYEPDRHLRLAAGFRLPGRGWLEFSVTPLQGGARSLIRQTATFDPKGVAGRLYWYGVLPLHSIVFGGLVGEIARRATCSTSAARVKAVAASSVVDAPPSNGARRLGPRWPAAALALAAAAASAAPVVHAQASTSAEVRSVPFVDLNRYIGGWFEIARYPNRFQRTCLGDVRASYARRPDGRLDVVNRCRTADGIIEARGIARVVDGRTSSRLKVRFAPAWLSALPFVWGDYWIIGLGDDYSWAVVGSPDRDYLWMLARTPRLDDQRIEAARSAARANGFDLDRLRPTEQRADREP